MKGWGCHQTLNCTLMVMDACREVAKAVKSKRARVVIVAPNIEHISTEGGLDDLLSSILSQADELGIPVVFALSRKKLGQVSSGPALHPKKCFEHS